MSKSIGKFDRRITFQSEVVTVNSFNEDSTSSWVDLVTTWAQLMPTTGTETYIADQLTVTNTVSFMIRYRTDINEMMRVVFEGKVYKIVSITEPAGTRRSYWQVKTELDYEAEP